MKQRSVRTRPYPANCRALACNAIQRTRRAVAPEGVVKRVDQGCIVGHVGSPAVVRKARRVAEALPARGRMAVTRGTARRMRPHLLFFRSTGGAGASGGGALPCGADGIHVTGAWSICANIRAWFRRGAERLEGA